MLKGKVLRRENASAEIFSVFAKVKERAGASVVGKSKILQQESFRKRTFEAKGELKSNLHV